MRAPYRPIACSLVDELQLRAMRGRPVTIRYRGAGDATTESRSVIRDVLSRDGAEYLVLDEGEDIRLDDLLEVDGLAFGESC